MLSAARSTLNVRRPWRRRWSDGYVELDPVTATKRLIAAARRRDASSFEVLVRLHVDRLHGAARLILRDDDAAHDAVQDALVRAWVDLPSLRDADRFEGWLQRLLVHACMDQLRRDRRWTARLRLLPPPSHVEAGTDAIADRDAIGSAFRHLSGDHRVILTLHFYLDLPPAEIAARMGIAPGTARSRLHYALEAFRAAMAADERSSEGASA